uniref:A-kinase interacting protein 1 n=1 Tax=Anas platyrhynchos platyrhynchos TaxID=8840 RepID=A0A493T2P7_ANAPP
MLKVSCLQGNCKGFWQPRHKNAGPERTGGDSPSQHWERQWLCRAGWGSSSPRGEQKDAKPSRIPLFLHTRCRWEFASPAVPPLPQGASPPAPPRSRGKPGPLQKEDDSSPSAWSLPGVHRLPLVLQGAWLHTRKASRDIYIEVSPGTYSITATSEDMVKQTHVVDVSAGQSIDLTFVL